MLCSGSFNPAVFTVHPRTADWQRGPVSPAVLSLLLMGWEAKTVILNMPWFLLSAADWLRGRGSPACCLLLVGWEAKTVVYLKPQSLPLGQSAVSSERQGIWSPSTSWGEKTKIKGATVQRTSAMI